MNATTLRFPAETLKRIDDLVGKKHRAKFIREAVERELERAEKALPPNSEK
ncbi:hypothetical protein [Brucella endophytica]|nr:hypothetical protein [Brucella endophytica]